MSESNNVKFVEDNGQWLWKRYDASGSVIFRSQFFSTEREAREDYDLNGGPVPAAPEPAQTEPEAPVAPASETEKQEAPAEGTAEAQAESTAGTATGEGEQREEANDAGSAIF